MKNLLLISALFVSIYAYSHEGHDEAPKEIKTSEKNYFSLNAASNIYEAVFRYEPIEAEHPTKMKLFISDFESNKSVDSAKIEVSSREDSKLKFSVKQVDEGQYEVTGSFPENKTYSLSVNISSGNKTDLLLIQGIEVGKTLIPNHDEHAHSDMIFWTVIAFVAGIIITLLMTRRKLFSKKTMSIFLLFLMLSPSLNNTILYAHEGHDEETKKTAPGNLADEMEILKETQFLFNIETEFSKYSDYYNILKLYGKAMPAINSSAQILAPQNGSIISLNVNIGENVGKGQILAVMEQTLSAPEQIQVLTEKSNAEEQYEIAKKEYERLKTIQDIVSKKDFQQAEIRYKTAEANKKVYDQLSANNSKLITVKSPISGKIDNFNLAIGKQVQQGEILFSVYDISTLKIEAQVYDKDAQKISGDVSYFVECVQENHHTEKAKLIAFSNVVNPVNQSTQLILEVDNSEDLFKPGQFVTVNVMAKKTEKHIVVPSSAITDINGKPAVFVHTGPENFKLKYIQPGESNSESTVVLKGLEENERVVMKSVYELKAIYLNQ